MAKKSPSKPSFGKGSSAKTGDHKQKSALDLAKSSKNKKKK